MKPTPQATMSPEGSTLRVPGVNGWFPPSPSSPTDQGAAPAIDPAQLVDISTARTLAPGQTLYAQDEDATCLFLIRSGIVRVSHLTAEGRRHILAFHWQGDLCGLMDNGRYVNSADALCKTEVLAMPRDRLRGLLLTQPLLQNEFLVKAAADLRNTQRMLVTVSGKDAAHRMASFLLECMHHADHYDPATHVVTLFADRRDIADYLGISGETVSRALGQLEQIGLIRRNSAREIAIESDALRIYAER